ncbi:hypothetical protein SAZ10_16710 [Mesorhizobium sp. BAC0120]|uniref:hypothetical protein n=1 Tax=Mesorhizobium sp. BAC0120 TaxID=3090670 RepID=UPI00298D5A44|nr:hypothetical protein [Mesorhizobium sp. BAC0120]MDW6023395.1 hypothetical protein [Mesorhizobium sp. BAC0120]
MIRLAALFGLASLIAAVSLSPRIAAAEDEPAYGPELQGFDYAYPVMRFTFSSQGQEFQMAYLDVKPPNPNGRTVVLLHG